MPSLAAAALFVHVAGVVAWVGGMAFAHFALRPAAAETLEPPQRLPLVAAALGRFFPIVTGSIVAVVASGFLLMRTLRSGAAVDAMAVIALAMVAVYAYVRVKPYRQLRAAVAGRKWPEAAESLARVRKAIGVNLALGTLTIAIATLSR